MVSLFYFLVRFRVALPSCVFLNAPFGDASGHISLSDSSKSSPLICVCALLCFACFLSK